MNGLELSDGEFQKFSNYVHDVSGINLHEGKKELLKARLGKVLRERNFSSFREYYEQVVTDQSGHELTILLNSISTNLTQFFREPEHFDFLKKKALSTASAGIYEKEKTLRIPLDLKKGVYRKGKIDGRGISG